MFVHQTIKGNYLFEKRLPGDIDEHNYNLILTDSDFNLLDKRIRLPLIEGPGLSLSGQLIRSHTGQNTDYHYSLMCDTVYYISENIITDVYHVIQNH